jgi:sigma-B regulation protein RsbU (phosphoserine phosphatase)
MELAFRNFIGILLVGAPFTVIYIYFVLEWHLRRNLVELFPKSALREIPPSRRIRALPKITLVSLLISILPLAIISYLTLSQIEQIAAGKQNIESFVSHMPLVIVFLFFLGLGMALELSVLMSRSISDPLNMAVDAMERMGGGDLDAVAPALCNDEIGDIAEGFNKMAEGLQERDRIKETFGHYLSEAVVKEILKSPESVKLGGEVRYMTVLVSDLRGFTHMTETLGPEDTLEVINRHLGKMTEIIHDYEGAIDEIAGDGLLVFFGAPTIMPDHTLRAVKCALDMQNAMDSLNRENLEMGLPVLEMGIGINCGELVVGNIGSERRKKYGAMGTPINVAYRVESRTKGGEILVTSTVKERLGEKLVVESFRNVSLKGLDGEKTLFVVSGLNGDG